MQLFGVKKMTQQQEGVGGRVKVVGRDTARTWKKKFSSLRSTE